MRRLVPLAALLAAFLALPASAQLELPTKPGAEPHAKPGSGAKKDEPPVPMPGTSRPKKQTATTTSKLSLPAPVRRDAAAGAASEPGAGDARLPGAPAAPAPGALAPLASGEGAGADGPADFIYAELVRRGERDPSLLGSAERSLVELGPGALDASRAALRGKEPLPLQVAARVLLRIGPEIDREAVVERLRQPLPKRSAGVLLGTLLELDPERATTSLLVQLLDHGQLAVRNEAERALQRRTTPDLLPQLLSALRSERADTRLRALSLASAVEDPAAMHVLLDSLSDPSAQVAYKACQALSGLQDERVEPALLNKAVGQPLILRPGAYALLALVLREERLGTPVLGEEHVPQLLDNLMVSQPLVAGACAAALAGIGFRSEKPEETAWLDLEVPHQLVRAVSAVEYHRDFTSLREPAERRLALISGRKLGSDGPAWQRWWGEAQPTFHARRAFLHVEPEDAGRVELHYRAAADGEDFVLAGPDVARSALDTRYGGGLAQPGLSETFHLSAAESADLVSLLRREGVFAGERLPGARGPVGSVGRRLEVFVGDQGKSFSFAEGIRAPWFDRIAEMALALRDRNRWQRFPDPVLHVDRRGLWEAERDWWGAEHTPLERDLRLKGLVLAATPAGSFRARDEGVAELEKLFEEPGVAGPGDFAPLLELLRTEPFFGQRARRIAALARQAARLASSPPDDGELAAAEPGPDELETDASGAPPGAPRLAAQEAGVPIEASLAGELMETLLTGFGVDAADELVALLDGSDLALADRAAEDVRPFVRALAAAVLARHAEGEHLERLLALLGDDNEDVEAAAVRALGEARVEEARTELLVRARVGDTRVRAAALRAAGRLGGTDARDALMLGLSEGEPELRLAATEGLAALADPSTAEVLVTMLLRGSGSSLYRPAREGLLAIGEPAWSLLLRAASTGSTEARREAALLLSEQEVALAASTLMTLLTETQDDERVAFELAILTGQDFRDADEPALAWWSWWDGVPHDDSLGWWLAACEEQGLRPPDRAALEGEGTRAGALFLLAVLRCDAPQLVERARRRLASWTGGDVGAGPLPPAGRARDAWLEGLEAWIGRRWPE